MTTAFHGVYLLYCENPKYLGRCYIGYTVDPNRRIVKHNKGKQYGGAYRTSQRGPWTMVLIVHGFLDEISALKFEWAWQHSQKSRRLQHVGKKKSREKSFDFYLTVLGQMLQVGPWQRLPLTIRWLNNALATDFLPGKKLPPHMLVCRGAHVQSRFRDCIQVESGTANSTCDLCFGVLSSAKQVTCLNKECNIRCHLICLSKHFLVIGEYVPIQGNCPKCKRTFLWGDIVRNFTGCYENVDFTYNASHAHVIA
ncbi:hypothetical protein HUJ04_001047 [Dendroctonus ponderosae]